LTPQNTPEQAAPKPRVSVVVVSHNRAGMLRACLGSLEKSLEREKLQLIVVDNGSTDGAAQLDSEFPKPQWIRLPRNFGLTKAWNLGWRAADAEYVLFLHDDVEVSPETIGTLADALDAYPDAVAVCPLLVDENGKPAPQLGSLPPDGKWKPAPAGGDGPAVVEYPRGAALMVRVFYIRAIRQIDERYGQFGADADLATQIQRASRKILLVPGARVKHSGRTEYTAEERADFLLARAVYLGKFLGFGEGLKARVASILGPLAGFRFGELKFTLSGTKIDGK
jgi:N-acetylglucosaminyl-diphospho-decaprenol L-rhamnosyltransferase